MLSLNHICQGDCQKRLAEIDSDSVDCIVTDPPYGLSFMGKDWDKAVPSIAIWQQCLRVLKPGAFAFVMRIPRQDCLARMICRLEDAGFNVAFSSIYWTYATGFPKAQNLSKAADKRAGVKREVVDKFKTLFKTDLADKRMEFKYGNTRKQTEEGYRIQTITTPATDQAKALDGAYSGFQPKPAVEIIIAAMKPLSERTYIDQAIANGHGCTWLDECRIPFNADIEPRKKWEEPSAQKEYDVYTVNTQVIPGLRRTLPLAEYAQKGRFPANVLCEDDVLDNGCVTKSTGGCGVSFEYGVFKGTEGRKRFNCGDSGSFSRYFSLDAWFTERIKSLPKEAQKTFPWLIVPKASKSEKNRGLMERKENGHVVEFKGTTKAWQCLECGRKYASGLNECPRCDSIKRDTYDVGSIEVKNYHPTCKPIKLMSWLITLASREGEIVLDPFCGSGTTLIAAKMLSRQYIGIEREEEYCEIARKRVAIIPKQLNNFY